MKKFYVLMVALSMASGASAQWCLPEGITFSNQSQIDNFQTNYPGCTKIEGNVVIEGNSISNLNGLSMLDSIGGWLSIRSNNALTSLTGLEGLVSIGYHLEIHSNNALTSLAGLENVTSIDGNLYIEDNQALLDLSGLNELDTIGGALRVIDNDSLLSLAGLEDLSFIGGDLEIGIYYDDGGGSFRSNREMALTSLDGLNSLTTIGGSLLIYGQNALTSLLALENLTTIDGNLQIGFMAPYYDLGNASLTSLSGLENINAASIDSLVIIENPSLSACNVQSICDYLVSLNGSVSIYNNATGCNNPPEVANGCGITMTCLPFGHYYFHHQSEIDNFQDNYPACVDLAGNIRISGTDIVNLEGLDPLHSVGGSLSIYSTGLTGFSGLDNLFSIGGNLIMYDNGSLTSLSGLESLNFLEGALWIGLLQGMGSIGNPMLTDISGLKNIEAGTLDHLSITTNPLLSDCAITSICDYLASPNGYITIGDNATGCNSQEEVEAACQVGVETPPVHSAKFKVKSFPNPFSDFTTIEFELEHNATVNLSIYNHLGQQVALLVKEDQAKGSQHVVWDAEEQPAGVYYFRLTASGIRPPASGKILKY
jgi:hypothetical protein